MLLLPFNLLLLRSSDAIIVFLSSIFSFSSLRDYDSLVILLIFIYIFYISFRPLAGAARATPPCYSVGEGTIYNSFHSYGPGRGIINKYYLFLNKKFYYLFSNYNFEIIKIFLKIPSYPESITTIFRTKLIKTVLFLNLTLIICSICIEYTKLGADMANLLDLNIFIFRDCLIRFVSIFFIFFSPCKFYHYIRTIYFFETNISFAVPTLQADKILKFVKTLKLLYIFSFIVWIVRMIILFSVVFDLNFVIFIALLELLEMLTIEVFQIKTVENSSTEEWVISKDDKLKLFKRRSLPQFWAQSVEVGGEGIEKKSFLESKGIWKPKPLVLQESYPVYLKIQREDLFICHKDGIFAINLNRNRNELPSVNIHRSLTSGTVYIQDSFKILAITPDVKIILPGKACGPLTLRKGELVEIWPHDPNRNDSLMTYDTVKYKEGMIVDLEGNKKKKNPVEVKSNTADSITDTLKTQKIIMDNALKTPLNNQGLLTSPDKTSSLSRIIPENNSSLTTAVASVGHGAVSGAGLDPLISNNLPGCCANASSCCANASSCCANASSSKIIGDVEVYILENTQSLKDNNNMGEGVGVEAVSILDSNITNNKPKNSKGRFKSRQSGIIKNKVQPLPKVGVEGAYESFSIDKNVPSPTKIDIDTWLENQTPGNLENLSKYVPTSLKIYGPPGSLKVDDLFHLLYDISGKKLEIDNINLLLSKSEKTLYNSFRLLLTDYEQFIVDGYVTKDEVLNHIEGIIETIPEIESETIVNKINKIYHSVRDKYQWKENKILSKTFYSKINGYSDIQIKSISEAVDSIKSKKKYKIDEKIKEIIINLTGELDDKLGLLPVIVGKLKKAQENEEIKLLIRAFIIYTEILLDKGLIDNKEMSKYISNFLTELEESNKTAAKLYPNVKKNLKIKN